MPFKPQRVLFERSALDYPLGQDLYSRFSPLAHLEVKILPRHNRVGGIPGKTPQEAYQEGKRTLVVGVRRTLEFQTCKPSAHYQLPLVSGCMGQCEYCYLNTQFGKRPYLRVYVNVEEILRQAQNYIDQRQPKITIFEGAATSDPVPVEPYTSSLGRAISFFAQQPLSRFRFVTKFTDVDSLLNLDHNGHTTIRFSINVQSVIDEYEHTTPRLLPRIEAAGKIAAAGYPLGFIIGPVILFDGWESKYEELLSQLKQSLPKISSDNLRFEVISHRFTARAKNTILSVYPQTKLPMDESQRQYKYGQFGYGKYVYPRENMAQINNFFPEHLSKYFPGAQLDYLI
ncbi:MAG: spore photoproduct lyase [Methylocystaceae bacterium]